jgi:hypothetical protein
VPRATAVTVQSRAFALVVLDLLADGGPDLTVAQAMRLAALCREADVTLLALGTPAVLRPLSPAAALRLRATPSLAGTRIALDRCAAAPSATVELHMVRYAPYSLRAPAGLRLAGPPAGTRR